MDNKEQPRIFHLITRLVKGGAESKTLSTVLGINKYRFTVGYGAEYDQEQVDKLERNDVGTVQFPLIRHYNPITAVLAVFSLAWYLRKNDFDIVHTHSTEAGIIGRLAATLAGVPVIVHTVHGVPFAEDRNSMLERFVLACERLTAPLTDTIVVNADALAEDYLARGIGTESQYKTVYSGINLESFRDVEPAPDVDGKGTRIVMVGRLVEGKGFDVLLDAVEQITDRNVSIYLVGEGPKREWLEDEISARGLEETVSMLGYRSDIPAIMSACDVFVLPSYREGTPRVITEAMASGLPVIATEIAGIPEQVVDGHSGYLIQPGDDEALARHLRELIDSPDRRQSIGATGRERVETFSEKTMVNDLTVLYADLLASKTTIQNESGNDTR